jgi:hypothetical protein
VCIEGFPEEIMIEEKSNRIKDWERIRTRLSEFGDEFAKKAKLAKELENELRENQIFDVADDLDTYGSMFAGTDSGLPIVEYERISSNEQTWGHCYYGEGGDQSGLGSLNVEAMRELELQRRFTGALDSLGSYDM